MANIITLNDFSDDEPGEDDVVFVNADTVTHWHRAGSATTMIHFVGGGSMTVNEDIWSVACQINPPPAITSVTRRIISGTLTPGEPVKIRSHFTYEDGSTDTTLHDTFFKESETNEYTGALYHRFVGGSFNGNRRPDGSFLFNAADFDTATN